jgi:protein HIRA/HIR1
MTRSWDGLTLYAASSDGTIGVFNFDSEELEGIAPHSVQEQYLAKFGFKAPPIPDGYSHMSTSIQATKQGPPSDFNTNAGEEKINVLVAKKSNKNKKRLNMSSIPSASVPSALPSASTNGLSSAKGPQTIPVNDFGRNPPSRVAASSFPSPAEQPFESSYARGDWDMDMGADMDSAPVTSIDGSISQAPRGGKVRDEGKAFVRNLGSDVQRSVDVVKQISTGTVGTPWEHQESYGLDVKPVMTYLNCEVEGTTDDILEVWNYENGGRLFAIMSCCRGHLYCFGTASTRITFTSGSETQWLDYVPSSVLFANATNVFCAVAMQDGSINVYSPNGRRLLPTLNLGLPASFMDANKHCLMVVTTNGQLYSWYVSLRPTTAK